MPTRQAATAVSVSEARSLFDDLKESPALVLAVSGGSDSTALMVLAARWAKARKKSPKLLAVTVDHGLRAESAREAATVKRLARQLGIEHRTVRWSGRKPKTGLQEAARDARYRLLSDIARKIDAPCILTAHTLDDQAETVLIRLTRGSGLTGLAAMRRVTLLDRCSSFRGAPKARARNPERCFRALPLDSGPGASRRPGMTTEEGRGKAGERALFIVRPLLDIPKVRLIAALEAAGIPFAEDPSNRDPRFTRARLRALMPALEREGLDARRLAVLARRLKRADAALEAEVGRAFVMLVRPGVVPGSFVLAAAAYAALPDEIGLRLLGRGLALSADGAIGLAKLEALKDALDAAQNAGISRFRRSLAGAMVTLTGGNIVLEPAPPRRAKRLTTPETGRRRGKAASRKLR